MSNDVSKLHVIVMWKMHLGENKPFGSRRTHDEAHHEVWQSQIDQ